MKIFFRKGCWVPPANYDHYKKFSLILKEMIMKICWWRIYTDVQERDTHTLMWEVKNEW